MYRNKPIIIYGPEILDKDGKPTGRKKVLDVRIEEEASDIYRFLTGRVFAAKADYYKIARIKGTTHNESLKAKSRWYHAVKDKDIWLRKYMQELGLYLKEIERSPGSALFGGG